jgi:energy-coupling factor transport system permease protein
MLRDITIGQYYPVDSVLHKLDARVKILSTFLFITALFIVDSFVGYGIIFFFLWAVVYLSKVPTGFIFRGLRGIMAIVLITVGINVFMTPGEQILWEFAFIKISIEGIYAAGLIATRLIFLITGSSLLTLTTSPIQLTDGIESLLGPFKRIGVPAHEIAMMMTIALRFIPTLLEETDKIMKAQMARGADFETGGIIKRARSLIPLLVPLFISAFRRADELAMAMEARCYRGGENRTRMKQAVIQKRDHKALAVMSLLVIMMILLRIL